MPTLTMPRTDAWRSTTSMLSKLAKFDPAVMAPTAKITTSARTRPALRPTPPLKKRRSAEGFWVGSSVCVLTLQFLS